MPVVSTLPRGRAAPDAAVQWLEHAIWSVKLKPGERIAESVIGCAFRRGPGLLRESPSTLEGRRLLERTPVAGVRAIQISADDLHLKSRDHWHRTLPFFSVDPT